jgi:hypothetical protein
MPLLDDVGSFAGHHIPTGIGTAYAPTTSVLRVVQSRACLSVYLSHTSATPTLSVHHSVPPAGNDAGAAPESIHPLAPPAPPTPFANHPPLATSWQMDSDDPLHRRDRCCCHGGASPGGALAAPVYLSIPPLAPAAPDSREGELCGAGAAIRVAGMMGEEMRSASDLTGEGMRSASDLMGEGMRSASDLTHDRRQSRSASAMIDETTRSTSSSSWSWKSEFRAAGHRVRQMLSVSGRVRSCNACAHAK